VDYIRSKPGKKLVLFFPSRNDVNGATIIDNEGAFDWKSWRRKSDPLIKLSSGVSNSLMGGKGCTTWRFSLKFEGFVSPKATATGTTPAFSD